MAGIGGGSGSNIAKLGLTSEEQRLFKQVFNLANPDGIEVVTGDVALRFLPDRTKLPSETLGEIWQLADSDDKGFITEEGFYILLRLIGYAQAGRQINGDLALKPGGPLPRLEGINTGPAAAASPLQAQPSGGPIKVPPLSPENAQRYAALFEQSGAQNGILDGAAAKSIFDHSKLPNDILVRIWNLADTESRGQLSITEFIIAMHLIASYRSGTMRALPRNLPAGLYDAAARRGVPARPISGGTPIAAIPRQFSGPTTPRTSSPLAGRSVPPPQPQMQAQSTGGWAVTPQEKTQYDAQFAKLDTQNTGYLSGEAAATFFQNSRLPEDDLAQVWDLADMNSEGQLNRDAFAVAMHLIRNRLSNRGPVPRTLPANLIPPSMRQGAQSQVAVPTSPPKPKSAVDDLFGLDALSESAPQVPQSTGGSAASPAPAPLSPSHTAQSSQAAHPTFFKPFVPTSSFGQSVVSPQTTGLSSQPTGPNTGVPQPRSMDQSFSSAAPGNDDLLGDTDPEISKRLTNETTELANLSNQVGNLANQMQEVKNKNSAVDANMSNMSKQKQAFEARLAQLRTAYEQEARDLRAKEDRLVAVENESKKLQSDLAMVQHTYTGLQEKKQQVTQSIEAQQHEIASYKEQLRNINAQVAQIKPEIDKAESTLRQQKGLNAITKKQVTTAEAEYEKLREQMDGLTRDNEEAINEAKDLDESHRNLQSRQSNNSVPVASPAASTASQSTNPFFRRQTTSSSTGIARTPTGQDSVQSPNHSAFDSFFNSAFPAAEGASVAPAISFGGSPDPAPESVPVVHTPPPVGNEREPQTPTQTESKIPPPPPQSRQITSSALPLAEKVTGPTSASSSVGVAPPASRFGEGSEATTPVKERQIPNLSDDPSVTLSPLNQTRGVEDPMEHDDAHRDIPGAFPGMSTPPETVAESAEDKEVDDPFGADALKRSASSKDDFDSAFAGFEDKGKGAAQADPFPASSRRDEEFPPIQVFENDSDSDSDEEGGQGRGVGKGFDDNFTTPDRGAVAARSEDRPDLSRGNSTATPLPSADAQQSPPPYDQNGKARSDSNQFPAEYGGLLPSREPPTSPDDEVLQQTSAQIGSFTPQENASLPAAPPLASGTLPTTAMDKSKDDFDDFDKEFGDLSEANVADEKGDEELGASRHTDFGDEFNPTFDSPAPSKMTASSAFGTSSGFDDFETNVSAPTQASNSAAPGPSAGADQDWDAMFAGLGKDNGVPQINGGSSTANATSEADNVLGGGSSSAAAGQLQTPTKPPLARGLSESGEHDDPILKRLTAMGYPRDQSLAALEKFDYNIDKAADFLTQQ